MPDTVIEPPPHTVPVVFTRALLDWMPWLEPLAVEALSERHMAALVDAARVKSAYFRLLARDPDALRARTLTDKDIFYNADAGLPRAERELAAAATSRFNGCIYCASVHARFSATYSKREADVQRLLDEGVNADLGERWNAIVAASVALSMTPITFGVLQLGQPADAVARRACGNTRNIAPDARAGADIAIFPVGDAASISRPSAKQFRPAHSHRACRRRLGFARLPGFALRDGAARSSDNGRIRHG
jgi:alkylhydroperoxidase domain protein